MNKLKLSIIITAKDRKSPQLLNLLQSIKQQTYPESYYEILVITDGDSESAKAIGLKQAKGRIVAIFASDNYLNDSQMIAKCLKPFEDDKITGSFPIRYWYNPKDNILNRYFALVGCNDPLPLYLGKNDRQSYREPDIFQSSSVFTNKNYKSHYVTTYLKKMPTLGDNGFFIRKGILMESDIEHYYHIDVCQDLFDKGYRCYALVNTTVWHRTGGNIFKFFAKRLKYADKFAVPQRRWRMITGKDIPRLLWFVFSTLTIVPCLLESIKGYGKVKDSAWFLHWIICLFTLLTYGVLCLKRLLFYVLISVRKFFTGV